MTEIQYLERIYFDNWYFFEINRGIFQNISSAIFYLTGVILGLAFGYGVTKWLVD